MNALNITIEDLSPPITGKTVKIAKFNGYLDSSNVEDSKEMFDKIIKANPTNLFLVFDFEDLAYLNSRAIGCLVECYQEIEKGGGRIMIAKPVDNVRDVITVVGIDNYITLYPTVEAAIEALR